MSVRLGIVGLGYWGPNLARALANVKDGELAAICDADADRLARFSALYPKARPLSGTGELFADPGVDAVVLATPVSTHFDLAKAALEAGKHVLVEKPLARSSRECQELVELADARGLVLMVGHVFLFNAAVRRVRDYIESGELGEIYYIYSQRLNLGQVRRDVNALWNFAPHDLSILAYWLGAEPERVVARGYSYIQPGIEDVVFMTLDYPEGIGANVHISWLDPHKVRLMTVVGSEKMVVFDDVDADRRITLYDKGVTRMPAEGRRNGPSLGRYESFAEFQLLHRAGDIVIPKVNFGEPLQLETQHFVDSIRDGVAPLTDGRHGLAIVRTLEAAQQSLERAGEAVPV